ncbi:MAG: DUF2791 family P-loop domain-containing protein, partial [Thermoplasmata archaeon]
MDFVGRENELAELEHYLEEAIKGHGKVVFLEGETGVGKTRLVNEVVNRAREKNVLVLSGRCHPGGEPYHPFITAFADTSSVEGLMLIYNDGRLMTSAGMQENENDSEVYAGMLSAIDEFARLGVKSAQVSVTVEDAKKRLKSIEYGEYKIVIEHGKYCMLAALVLGREPRGLRSQLRDVLENIESEYAEKISSWDGDVESIGCLREKLITVVSSRKFGIQKLSGTDSKLHEIKGSREGMFEYISEMLGAISREQPVILFLDDLHWADESSLSLMHYVAYALRTSRVLIIGTYRPEDIDEGGQETTFGLRETLRKMSRERLFTIIELPRLGRFEIEKMIDSIFNPNDFTKEFKFRLFTETEGNPFFVEEVLKSLFEEGVIYKEGKGKEAWQSEAWHSKGIEDVKLPKSIKDVVLRRYDRLDDNGKKVLRYASAIGQEFEFKVLCSALAIEEDKLAEELDKLKGARLVKESEHEGLLRFDHSMIQEVIYEEMGTRWQKIVHERIGNSIEKMCEGRHAEVAGKLSYHYMKCENEEKAVKYSILAGEVASRKFAYSEASKYYEIASQFLLTERKSREEERERKRKKIEVLLGLEQIARITGEIDNALQYNRQLLKLARELGDDKRRAEIHRNIGTIMREKNEWEEALENYEKSYKISEKLNEVHGSSESLVLIGEVHWAKGELNKSVEYFKKAISIAERVGDAKVLAMAYMNLGLVSRHIGELSSALVHYEKSLSFLSNIGDAHEMARAYNNIGHVYWDKGDHGLAIENFEKCISIAQRTGNIKLMGVGLADAGWYYAKMQEFEKAVVYLDRALEIFEKLGNKLMIAKVYVAYGVLYKLERNWQRSTEYFLKGIEINEEIGIPAQLAENYFEFALMYRERGNMKKAIGLLKKA